MTKRTPSRPASLNDADAKSIATHINAAFETGDPMRVLRAIGTGARARGMSHVARQIRAERAALYRSLQGDTDPRFGTILRVLDVLGVKLTVTVK